MSESSTLLRSPPRAGHSCKMAQIFQEAGLKMQRGRENCSALPYRPHLIQSITSGRRPIYARHDHAGDVARLNERSLIESGTAQVTQPKQEPYADIVYPELPAEPLEEKKPPAAFVKSPQIKPTGIRGIARRPTSSTTIFVTPVRKQHPHLPQWTPGQSVHERHFETPSRRSRLRGGQVPNQASSHRAPSTGSWSGDDDYYKSVPNDEAARPTPPQGPPAVPHGENFGTGKHRSAVAIRRKIEADEDADWWKEWINRSEHVATWLDKVESGPSTPIREEAEAQRQSDVPNAQDHPAQSEGKRKTASKRDFGIILEESKAVETVVQDHLASPAGTQGDVGSQAEPSQRLPSPDFLPDNITTPMTSAFVPTDPKPTESTRRSSESTGLSDDRSDHGAVPQKYRADFTLSGPEIMELLTPQRKILNRLCSVADAEAVGEDRDQTPNEGTTEYMPPEVSATIPEALESIVKRRREQRLKMGLVMTAVQPLASPATVVRDNDSVTWPPLPTPQLRGGAHHAEEDDSSLVPLSPDVEVHRGNRRRRNTGKNGKQRCASYFDQDVIGVPAMAGFQPSGGGVAQEMRG